MTTKARTPVRDLTGALESTQTTWTEAWKFACVLDAIHVYQGITPPIGATEAYTGIKHADKQFQTNLEYVLSGKTVFTTARFEDVLELDSLAERPGTVPDCWADTVKTCPSLLDSLAYPKEDKALILRTSEFIKHLRNDISGIHKLLLQDDAISSLCNQHMNLMNTLRYMKKAPYAKVKEIQARILKYDVLSYVKILGTLNEYLMANDDLRAKYQDTMLFDKTSPRKCDATSPKYTTNEANYEATLSGNTMIYNWGKEYSRKISPILRKLGVNYRLDANSYDLVYMDMYCGTVYSNVANAKVQDGQSLQLLADTLSRTFTLLNTYTKSSPCEQAIQNELTYIDEHIATDINGSHASMYSNLVRFSRLYKAMTIDAGILAREVLKEIAPAITSICILESK